MSFESKPWFYVEVLADDSGVWVGNSLKFPNREQAEHYGRDLASRWTAVREWRVVEEEAHSVRD